MVSSSEAGAIVKQRVGCLKAGADVLLGCFVFWLRRKQKNLKQEWKSQYKSRKSKKLEPIFCRWWFLSGESDYPLRVGRSLEINPLPDLNRIQFSQNRMLENKPSSFISKLNLILKSKKFHSIIALDLQKGTINIFDKEKLEQEILPDYFRHNKLSSFIRQLNLYGFKKIKHPSIMCFSHPILAKGKSVEMIQSQKKLRSAAIAQREDLSHFSRSCQQNNPEVQNPPSHFSEPRIMQPNQSQSGQSIGGGVQGLGYSVMPLGGSVWGWSFPPPAVVPYFWSPGALVPGVSPLLFAPNNIK